MNSPAEQKLQQALEERRVNSSLRKLSPVQNGFVDFCSNDYLGLARSENFLREFENEWKRLRETNSPQLLGSGGSRLLSGDSEYAENLETELTAFYKSEAGLIFNSGYAANLGLFASIPQRGDTILYDELIHASVRDGIRLSHAKSWSFRHNDVEHLKSLLEKAEGNVFIAAESVYSMDGDVCPLADLVALGEKHGANLILDEAHSNGLFGKQGEGKAVAENLHERIFARLLTFGKAPGCHGAFVAGSKLLRDYLINFARPFIYSTALPLHSLAAIRCSVKLFSGMHEERKRLNELIRYFNAKTSNRSASSTAIHGIIIPGNENVRAAAKACNEKKIDVRPVLSPTVPEGKERLRVILHSFNTEGEIDKLLAIFRMELGIGN